MVAGPRNLNFLFIKNLRSPRNHPNLRFQSAK
jgi:hypothetical protein